MGSITTTLLVVTPLCLFLSPGWRALKDASRVNAYGEGGLPEEILDIARGLHEAVVMKRKAFYVDYSCSGQADRAVLSFDL
jgi:hypothetical protein